MWRKQEEHKAPAPSDAIVSASPAEPQNPESSPVTAMTPVSHVAQGLFVKGEIAGTEDLVLDGSVQGRVNVAGARVMVGPHGRVDADIHASEIVVQGRVRGALHAGSRVTLDSSAEVSGSVFTRRIVIEDGAIFNGQVEIVPAERPRSSLPKTSGPETAERQGMALTARGAS